MKKILKKVIVGLLIIILLVPCFTVTRSVTAASDANTLKELRAELAKYKALRDSANYNKDKTQNEINENKNEIIAAQTQIDNNKKKIEESKKEIEKLNVEIEETEEKINDLMRAYEISQGDNNYLEYIFGATSISDFIIRLSISEQLASYNDGLIDDYEEKIETNEQLQENLKSREKELKNQIEKLENSIDKLGKNLDAFAEDALDANNEIKAVQELINTYEKMGCGENENLEQCMKLKGDTKFIRPLKQGTITSYYGYRIHPVSGVYKLHTGIDLGGAAEGSNVYSVANGSVGMIVRESSCGGNMVYIYHNVNGQKYTSVYMHLMKINVSVGQTVSNTTVIGTLGGGYLTKQISYVKDTCSTGPHLHFGLAKGWYGNTYVSYSTYVANLVNPRDLISFPNMYTYFYTR